MCGIAGVVSYEPIEDRLYEGIHHLEYRGYDSCGVAFHHEGHIEIRKNTGTVDEVHGKENLRRIDSYVGIAHTRWATHGRVTRDNAHPHRSRSGEFVVVHNGIISNYKLLRQSLIEAGYEFASETDTEVIAHLLEDQYSRIGDIERAWVATLRRLEGSFALAMISVHAPEFIYCARHESPLIIGVGSGSNYVGSDFNAFIEYTKNTVILDDGEYGIVTKNSYAVKSLKTGDPVAKGITVVPWDPELAGKSGYPHYMLKEIHEQPQAVRRALHVADDDISEVADMLVAARRIHLIGVGTTYYASMFGQYVFADLAKVEVAVASSDEFRHLDLTDDGSVVLAVSQSGETYDTIMSLRHAKERGAKTAAIVNVMGSSMARLVDRVILQASGPEVCVVSTKAGLVQMVLLTRLAIAVGVRRGVISAAEREEYEAALATLPEHIDTILNERSGVIRAAAYAHARKDNWLFLGRGIYYPIALEAALKMKEVTYVHAEGMAGGFLKHGTLSLIDDRFNTLVFTPPSAQADLHAATMSSAEEVKARGGFVLGYTFDRDEDLYDQKVVYPDAHRIVAPYLPLVGAQLLAYFTATALKRNVDKPRSLAKSVTVA